MIAEDDDRLAALARRLPLQLLQRAHDLERIRASVGNVPELDKDCLAAHPVPLGVDEPGTARNVLPRRIVAMEIADRGATITGC